VSLLNVWILPESALIGVDTAAPGAQVSKLFPLIHANAVIAARGDTIILTTVAGMSNGPCGDYDALCESMPMIMPAALAMAAEHHQLGRQEICVVGWSAHHGRICGMSYCMARPHDALEAEAIDPHYITPWDSTFSKLPDPVNSEGMFRLALAQVAYVREKAPEAPIGGQLILTKVKKNSIAVAGGAYLERSEHGGHNR
jgi:hypothetical protein